MKKISIGLDLLVENSSSGLIVRPAKKNSSPKQERLTDLLFRIMYKRQVAGEAIPDLNLAITDPKMIRELARLIELYPGCGEYLTVVSANSEVIRAARTVTRNKKIDLKTRIVRPAA